MKNKLIFTVLISLIFYSLSYAQTPEETKAQIAKALSEHDFSKGLAPIKSNGFFGYINSAGAFVVKPQYNEAATFFECGLAPVLKNNKIALINKQGEEVTAFKYEGAQYHAKNRILVANNKKIGMLNEKGREIIPLKYDYIDKFENGNAITFLNNKKGLVTYEGKELVEPKYDYISGGLGVSTPFYDCYMVKLNKKKRSCIS